MPGSTGIVWDAVGERLFELGVDHGVLYPFQSASSSYAKGVAWNGLTAVNETPSGAEANDMYADNIKYGSIRSNETFGATLEAYMYPDEFMPLDGSAEIATGVYAGQQTRGKFGLSYRTKIGNDVDLDEHGYKLHLAYGLTASPSERAYSTVNDSPEAQTLSWELTSDPVTITGFKPTALLTIDSTKADKTKLKALEDILYGVSASEEVEPRLPMPDEVIQIMGTDPIE